MQVSVIYSFDCPRGVSVKSYLPDGCYRKAKSNPWQLTEGDEQYDYGYLEGVWEHGKHRKFCGLLTDDQWQAFASDKCLAVECRNTMGMIGAPGAGLGCLPAVAFHTPDDEAIVSCYAFPLGTRADCVQFLTRMGYEVPAIFTDVPGFGAKRPTTRATRSM